MSAADETTGHDARLFLERFMARFPRFRKAPLWLSGESFGVRSFANSACVKSCVLQVLHAMMTESCVHGKQRVKLLSGLSFWFWRLLVLLTFSQGCRSSRATTCHSWRK